MNTNRRNFLRNSTVLGALAGGAPLWASPALRQLTEQQAADDGGGFDPEAVAFWAGFNHATADPLVREGGRVRGAGGDLSASSQPVFLHYSTDGFRYAAQLDATQLVPEGDVLVSLNTQTIKVSKQDQKTFDSVQNAQLRLDVAQGQPLLPVVEAMAYTLMAGMHVKIGGAGGSAASSNAKGAKPAAAGKSGGGGAGASSAGGSLQDVSVSSDAAWQKMQNIPLPGGEGRWALNLEAQRKPSFLTKLLQETTSTLGHFAPMLAVPGMALSGLDAFNTWYGYMHSEPVDIIKTQPTRVFATQSALNSTGAPGAANGILLQPGVYILIPANQLPSDSDLKKLTVMSGCIVPTGTRSEQVNDAALDTLGNTTYVTFAVEVKPTSILTQAKASGF